MPTFENKVEEKRRQKVPARGKKSEKEVREEILEVAAKVSERDAVNRDVRRKRRGS